MIHTNIARIIKLKNKILDFHLFYFTIIIMVDTSRTKLEHKN
jgi:hypothetical protein